MLRHCTLLFTVDFVKTFYKSKIEKDSKTRLECNLLKVYNDKISLVQRKMCFSTDINNYQVVFGQCKVKNCHIHFNYRVKGPNKYLVDHNHIAKILKERW